MKSPDFSLIENNHNLIYLDTAASALTPQVVIDAMVDYYQNYPANIHRGIYPMSEKATASYELARTKVAQLIGAQTEEIIFTSGSTASINTVASSYRNLLTSGDEIVVPVSEHHANFLPWQRLCKQTGAKLILIPVEDLSEDKIKRYISKRTKLIAFAHASNVLGHINDVKKITKSVKAVNPSVHIIVDGAQAVPHIKVDVKDMQVDYYAFSGHKIYGPTGIGALWFSQDMQKVLKPITVGGGAVGRVDIDNYELLAPPHGFEAGTPPIAEAIGMGAAADYTASLADTKLADSLYARLSALPFVKVIGDSDKPRVPLVSFNLDDIHSHDVAQFLADKDICVRAGHHCTMPLHDSLGIQSSVRASLGIYNTAEDIDVLVNSLTDCYDLLKDKA